MSELKTFGLTYAEIGKALGISRQRAEQIINSHYVSLFQYKPKVIKGRNIISLLLRMQNKSVKGLAGDIGISPLTLYNKIYSGSNGSNLRRRRHFTLPQAQSVAEYFNEVVDTLFEKVPYGERGRKPFGKGV